MSDWNPPPWGDITLPTAAEQPAPTPVHHGVAIVPHEGAELAALRARVAELEAALRNFRDNYDHDENAHQYRTPCRVCEAEKLIGEATP